MSGWCVVGVPRREWITSMRHATSLQLYEHTGIGVILFYPSGVRYSNQTGGYACLHPEAEGVYLPLGGENSPVATALNEHFETVWAGHCYDRIDGETADLIDQLLASVPETDRFRVERDRLANSHEAWIYVRLLAVDGVERPAMDFVSGFPAGTLGVLTWENSD